MFDGMRDKIINEYKQRYKLKEDDVTSYYFEGNLEKATGEVEYLGDVQENNEGYVTNFNVNFEIEVKITPQNYIFVQYDNFICNKTK